VPNRIAFTQLAVERLKVPDSGRIIYWDKLVPGFGLRVSAPRPGSRDGRKTWIAMYRVAGKPVMETLGTLAQIPKVDRAREAARVSFLRARAGGDPIAERRAEVVRKATEAAAAEAAAQHAVTGRFTAVADRYMREHVERNCAASLIKETRRILERDVKPRWGERTIGEITKGDVNDLLDAIAGKRDRKRRGAEGGAAVQANRTLTRLKTLFRWAVAKDLITADPTEGVHKAVKEIARDRYLDDEEIRLFWAGCDGLGWPFGSLLKMLLLTAQRRDEVGEMQWSELDFAARTWTIPGTRAKNDKAHIVHLCEIAIELLETMPRETVDGRPSAYVFTTTGRAPVSGYSKIKDHLDRHMAGSAPWILHDLRRTATTGMAQLNIAPHVVDKILNHTAGTIRGVAATYNRFEYLPERKAALEAWSQHVADLVGLVRRPAPEAPDNVIELAAVR
jgi:integrase